jgi:hypothetical protein
MCFNDNLYRELNIIRRNKKNTSNKDERKTNTQRDKEK